MTTDPLQDPMYARLLAGRDDPSVLEKEALWARVEADLEAAPGKPWLSRLFPALTLAATAAAALLVFFALPDDEYGVRGGERASVRATCLVDGAPVVCAPGARLIIEAQATKDRPYAGAFLESGAEVVWLFDASKPAAGGRAFQIPNDFDAADGKLVIVFAAVAHDRAALEAKLEGEASGELTVVEKRLLEVKP